MFALNEKMALNLLNSVGYRIVSRLTSHSPEELYGGRVFRIRKIGAVFRFLERFLRKYMIKFHTYIFGINLFVFCERPKGMPLPTEKKAMY